MITESDIIDVAPDLWVETCAAYRERGFGSVDWLTAVDRGGTLEVLVHLVDSGAGEEAIVRTCLPVHEPALPSLSDDFPGADWHERETREMYGIEFRGRTDTEPLLLRAGIGEPPMRKAAPLGERVSTPWPGAEEGSGRRRRRLPPGVRAEWVDPDG